MNYNAREHLRACLATVLRQNPGEVIVVDNASTDGSADMVRAEFPQVVLDANEENVGYGAAANQAIARCGTPYVLLLNADTRLSPGALRELAGYMDSHPRAAILGPRLLNPDGSFQLSCFPFPGTFRWLLENEPLSWGMKYVPMVRRRLLRFAPLKEPRAVPWVLGAALLIRRQAFEEVGGFDESYFMYYEEADLSRRLYAAGWQVHFSPTASVVHVGGVSTSQCLTAMRVQHFASTMQFYRRHYSGPRLAFWIGAMKLKTLALLVRDTVLPRIGWSTRPADEVAQEVEARRIALFGSPEEEASSRRRILRNGC